MIFQPGKYKTLLCVEPEAYEGVRRIAGKVAKDMEAVTGKLPRVAEAMESDCQVVLCATLGRSPLADRLVQAGALDAAKLSGKREVYQIAYAELEGQTILVICGSDKRGTIYGMFALSEYLGVSPLCYWGDVKPARREEIAIGSDIETISREPSVKYRGFFINDEWPCFGSWAESHFGDVNADCYDRIFEFLLRMKGNYLWPAMWRASFPLDGPGSANEELADLYGVVMGYSHHEPCLRASEEWDKVRGDASPYGTAWNYYTNEQGLLNYWEDALKRSGGYENIITIGMRGERDTSMLGENATLEENISLLRRIITKQRELIRKHVPREHTQMLALYKEVERYFYGDAETEGLRSWKELDDVLFMLCEDNFGHLRTVPPKELKEHPGGWGMYYHFDYHGGPISYEWVDSTPMSQTWEQMTQAWDYGIRDLWIVNVGDIKFHEVPLTYFLSLAYDFDRWGTSNPNSAREYAELWAAKTFPGPQQTQIAQVLQDYIHMNSLRRPEALHAGIYHPCHYNETDRMLALAEDLQTRSDEIYAALAKDAKDAYYSMIHYSVSVSVNLLKMHLYAGKNAHYAAQGKPIANRYAALCEECIQRDLDLAEQFGTFLGGKWNGMQLAPHIGFTRWNEDDNRYPVLSKVTPVRKQAMKVGRADREQVFTRIYGGPAVVTVEDFRCAGVERVRLEIANGGTIPFDYQIVGTLPEWLSVSPASGTVTDQVEVTLTCDRSRLPEKVQTVRLLICGDGEVAVDVTGQADSLECLPPMTFVQRNGYISMLAEHACKQEDTEGAAFVRIGDYGKFGSGMKVFPTTAEFGPQDAKPSLTYRFRMDEPGDYRVEIFTAPNNPIRIGDLITLQLENGHQTRLLKLLPPDFRAGESSDPLWASGVLNQAHNAVVRMSFAAGIQTLTVSAMSPGVVLEKIVISKDPLLPSYSGPEESPFREA